MNKILKPRVLVVGSGWGGYQTLLGLNPKRFDVSMITTRDHMCFTPLLAGAATGSLSLASVAQPIRQEIAKRGGHFYLARAQNIDFENNTLVAQPILPRGTTGKHFGGHSRFVQWSEEDEYPPYNIQYDALVLAPGMVPHSFGIEGVEDNCYSLKYVADAQRIRNKIIALFDRATHPNLPVEAKKQLLSFVVCGGGPTGTEFTAELLDLLNQCAKQNFKDLQPFVNVTMIEGAEVLSNFSGDVSKYVKRKLIDSKVNVIIGDRVTKVDEKAIHLQSGQVIPFGICIWSAGNKPVRLVEQLEFEKSRSGKLLVNDYLQVKGQKNIFCIGDSAEIEGCPLPPTAQVAAQQGSYIAKQLNKHGLEADFDGKGFLWNNKGQMAFIGKKLAVLETPTSDKPAGFKGFLPFLVWKGFYFQRQFSFRNRFMIFNDWLRTFMFGRTMMRF